MHWDFEIIQNSFEVDFLLLYTLNTCKQIPLLNVLQNNLFQKQNKKCLIVGLDDTRVLLKEVNGIKFHKFNIMKV